MIKAIRCFSIPCALKDSVSDGLHTLNNKLELCVDDVVLVIFVFISVISSLYLHCFDRTTCIASSARYRDIKSHEDLQDAAIH